MKYFSCKHVLISLILLAAAWLRLSRLDLMEFKLDEALSVMMVMDALDGKGIPTHGIASSVGVYNPPIFIYLLLAPGLFSSDPIWLTQFIALLNVAAIFLCYWFGRKIWNDRIGLIAAVLFATSPWAVIYSRKIWAPDVMPIFSLLVLGGLHQLCAHGDRRWFLPVVIAAGLMPGIHFVGLFAALIVGLFILVFRPKVGWMSWLVAGIVLAMMYLPFLLKDWATFKSGPPLSAPAFSVTAFVLAGEIMSHFGIDYLLLGDSARNFYQTLTPAVFVPLTFLGKALMGLFAAGFVMVALELLQPFRHGLPVALLSLRPKAGKLAAWLLVILPLASCIVLPLNKKLYHHYFTMLYPVQFWLFAAALDWGLAKIPSWGQRLAQLAGYGFVGITAAFQIIFLVKLAGFIDRQGGTTGDYGVSYRHKLAAAEYVATSCRNDRAQPRLLAPDRTPLQLPEYDYLIKRCQKKAGALSETETWRQFVIAEQIGDSRRDSAREAETPVERRNFGPVQVLRLSDVPTQALMMK